MLNISKSVFIYRGVRKRTTLSLRRLVARHHPPSPDAERRRRRKRATSPGVQRFRAQYEAERNAQRERDDVEAKANKATARWKSKGTSLKD